MEIHFCDTNILLGICHPSDKFYQECRSLMEDDKYNFTYSYRSFDEINNKLRNVRRLFPEIKNYVKEPKLISSKLKELDLQTIKRFIKNRKIEDFRSVTYSDKELFQMIRDYEEEIKQGKKEILTNYNIEPFPHYEDKGTIMNININNLMRVIEKWIQKEGRIQEKDCKLTMDSIMGFKTGCNTNGWSKLSFITTDGDILNNKGDLVRDISEYFKSIKDNIDIRFSHIKDICK